MSDFYAFLIFFNFLTFSYLSSATFIPKDGPLPIGELIPTGIDAVLKNSLISIPNIPKGKIVEKDLTFPGAPPGFSIEKFRHHAGYVGLPRSFDARMFYVFFESRQGKRDSPVVLWLQGGPGSSSLQGGFALNGPFKVRKNTTLEWNDYGWDKASNILFIDNPIGAGFSYTSDCRDIRHDETAVSDDLYDFLQAFFTEHKEYVKNDFYLTGESYAGHYIPALASRINQGNKGNEGIHINLKGMAMGDPWTNVAAMYGSYADYAYKMGLINQSAIDDINETYPECERAIKQCTIGNQIIPGFKYPPCWVADYTCGPIRAKLHNISGGRFFTFDIRMKTCNDCFGLGIISDYLNKPTVKDALGVGDLIFGSQGGNASGALMNDWYRNLDVGIPALLEDGIQLLVYIGEYDLQCNWIGSERWVQALQWSGNNKFASSPETPFRVDGAVAGALKSHGPLSFLKVKNAGHAVPFNQPKVALEMLRGFIHGGLNNGSPSQ